MRVLVVGGAGYIGSHMVKVLRRHGHEVLVLDDFSTGHRDAVHGVDVVEGSLGDWSCLDRLFAARPVDAVMHFASFIQVGESVRDPAPYYRNNVVNTLTLLEALVAHGVTRFIFSSSAAVYGEPLQVPIPESCSQAPVNPYGPSKWMVEQMLADFEHAYGLRWMAFRYFNAAGADPDGGLGERHEPETHLIPLVLQAASGRRNAVQVFGRDYPTVDGTCVRDYIHVMDLCEAHLLGLHYLMEGGSSRVLNLGNGAGYSVQEVIEVAERVTGQKIPVMDAPRRPGDPPVLVADASQAQKMLGWKPAHPALERIIADAWQWEQRRGGQV